MQSLENAQNDQLVKSSDLQYRIQTGVDEYMCRCLRVIMVRVCTSMWNVCVCVVCVNMCQTICKRYDSA